MPPASRCARIPLPGASANSAPPPTASRCGVPGLGVEQVGLDERRADVLGLRVGEQRPDPRPRAVRADQQVVVTVEPSAKVSSCRPSPRGRTLVTLCPHWIVSAGSESSRIRRRSPRSTSGRPPVPSSGLVEQDGAVRVEDPHRLAALVDDGAELVDQAGRLEGELPVVLVDVEHAALRARRRRGLGLVDRGRDAVDVQDAGEREAAESGADDRDWEFILISWLVAPAGNICGVQRIAWNVVPDQLGTTFQRCQDGAWQRTRHRSDARTLSRERIVDAAIGSSTRGRERPDLPGLPSGSHRARRDLLARGEQERSAAAAATPSSPRTWSTTDVTPEDAIRALALGVFDAIDAHPWVGAALTVPRRSRRRCGSSNASARRSARSASR